MVITVILYIPLLVLISIMFISDYGYRILKDQLNYFLHY